jgi:hypothetical protein
MVDAASQHLGFDDCRGYVIGTAILRRRSPKIDATAEKADVD